MKNTQSVLITLNIKTSDGVFAAHYSDSGLARLDWPTTDQVQDSATPSPAVRRWHKLTGRAVDRVLQGAPVGEIPPFDLSNGTVFQRKVWDTLQRIPTGRTQTYAQIATSVGRAKAARAAGGACGANPIPLLIPCHRVVATGGGLGGFSGGLPWKKKLLTVEGTAFKA